MNKNLQPPSTDVFSEWPDQKEDILIRKNIQSSAFEFAEQLKKKLCWLFLFQFFRGSPFWGFRSESRARFPYRAAIDHYDGRPVKATDDLDIGVEHGKLLRGFPKFPASPSKRWPAKRDHLPMRARPARVCECFGQRGGGGQNSGPPRKNWAGPGPPTHDGIMSWGADWAPRSDGPGRDHANHGDTPAGDEFECGSSRRTSRSDH